MYTLPVFFSKKIRNKITLKKSKIIFFGTKFFHICKSHTLINISHPHMKPYPLCQEIGQLKTNEISGVQILYFYIISTFYV